MERAEIICLNTKDENGKQPAQQDRVYDTSGIMTTLTAELGGRFNILERRVLVPKRTEYGKKIRKAYESGLTQESRHKITAMEPREDGLCNTLTTVQKDNLVVEASGLYSECSPAFQRKPLPGLARTLKAEKHDSAVLKNDRIRKLTPLECFRLMGFTDEDFDRAKWYSAGESEQLRAKYPKRKFKTSKDNRIERVSDSQLYKQAGNSIIVPVLEAIFGKMI